MLHLYSLLELVVLLEGRECDLAVDASDSHLVNELVLDEFPLLLLLSQLLFSLSAECGCLVGPALDIRLDIVYQVLVQCLVYLYLKVDVIQVAI